MKHSGKFGSKAGVTLVELLVVILIVIILSVTLLPLLGPFVTKAKYTADAIPQVGNIRTKVELYKVEHNVLPGVAHNAGEVKEEAPGQIAADGGTSYLGAGFLTQGFLPTSNDAGDLTVYDNAVLAEVGSPGTYPGATTTNSVSYMSDHFARHLDLNYQDLTGKNLRPNHVHYWSCNAGHARGGYVYAVGIFGDGNGLPSGTGYAVLELYNPTLEQKRVLTWERWKEVKDQADQITFVCADDDSTYYTGDMGDVLDANICWLPSKARLSSTNSTQFSEALDAMKLAGWE